jgi:hypothetical protein
VRPPHSTLPIWIAAYEYRSRDRTILTIVIMLLVLFGQS